jgi:hypothetical protein
MKLKNLLFLGIFPLISGCANNVDNFVNRYWLPDPTVSSSLLKAVPPYKAINAIYGETFLCKNVEDAKRKCQSNLLSKRVLVLGTWSCSTLPLITNPRPLVSRLGGDSYQLYAQNGGVATGTRMVPVGYTTPQTVYTTGQSAGYGNYTGSYAGNYGRSGTVYGNSAVNAVGSSQTTIGGTTTYAAQQYQYAVADQMLVVLASPKRVAELVQLGVLPPVANSVFNPQNDSSRH